MSPTFSNETATCSVGQLNDPCAHAETHHPALVGRGIRAAGVVAPWPRKRTTITQHTLAKHGA
jgi:hypothetical protein